MKALLTAAVVVMVVQPAFAQPRTPNEIADCVINEAAYYRQRLTRELPDPKIERESIYRLDPVVVVMTTAIAKAIENKCAVK